MVGVVKIKENQRYTISNWLVIAFVDTQIDLLHNFRLKIYYWSTIGVSKLPIAIVIVVFEILIVNDSDSIGHPWNEHAGFEHYFAHSYVIFI